MGENDFPPAHVQELLCPLLANERREELNRHDRVLPAHCPLQCCSVAVNPFLSCRQVFAPKLLLKNEGLQTPPRSATRAVERLIPLSHSAHQPKPRCRLHQKNVNFFEQPMALDLLFYDCSCRHGYSPFSYQPV